MSFEAYLHLEGRNYEAAKVDWQINQPITTKGRAAGKVTKGPIWVELRVTGTFDDILAWAMNSHKQLSGRIFWTDPTTGAPARHLWFTDAFCVSHGESFDSRGTTHEASIKLKLCISPMDMGTEVGGGGEYVPPAAREHNMMPTDGGGGLTLANVVEAAWNGLTDNYITDKSKLATLKQALVDQKKMLLVRQAELKHWNEADIECFQEAFGSSLPQHRLVVQSRVNEQIKLVDEFLKNDAYKEKFFPNSAKAPVVAHVFRFSSEHEINIAEKFWQLDPKTRAGVLVHEMSHFSDK
ncbi:MAG TPA: type VI secretion system tube protein TssD, partial [Hymenobacter sp.]|nr:type VI secretion system tube protein TssD [Hymenobacter sp.]